jgi:SAM-dependent methyltransferase
MIFHRYNYTMDKYRSANLAMWDELVAIHAQSEMYALKEFKRGKNKLNSLERKEVGSVKGKSMLHLQCHFGMDTLSWARLGARVTGVDFSSKAIALAQSLSSELNIPGRFICCELNNLPKHLDEKFDIVFTSYGVLCWLPDLKKWAELIARYLKPGGMFYIVEAHPFAYVFESEGEVKDFQVGYSYFQKTPLRFEGDGDYADPDAHRKQKVDFEWMHSLGEIANSLINAGLQIEFIHEFPFICWKEFPFLVKSSDGNYHLPKGMPSVPLTFSLKALKVA